MSEAKHTPGPWEFGSGDNYYVRADAYPKNFPHHFKSDDLGDYLAYVGNRADDFGEANARLIAAAPRMLAALANVQRIIADAAMTGFNHKDGDWPERLFASQAVTSEAIREATGSARASPTAAKRGDEK